MTFNGSDFNHYSDGELRQILLNTLMQEPDLGGNLFPSTPRRPVVSACITTIGPRKRVMTVVDQNWEDWLVTVRELESMQ